MVLAAAILAMALRRPQGPPPTGPTPRAPTAGDPGHVVLTASQARTGAPYLRADAYWTPTEADARPVEEALRRRASADGRPLPAGLLGYCRQYLGIVARGRRLVYVNGFRPAVLKELTGVEGDWHRRPVLADDGGEDFFHITYDPKARRFHGFCFNGYA